MSRAVETAVKVWQQPDVAERAGILAASTSVGRSFSRGLLPRSTADQAVITGTTATINYGLTTFYQSLIEATANRLVGSRSSVDRGPVAERALAIGADLAAIGIGIGLRESLRQRPQEPLRRAWLRAGASRLAIAGFAGAVIRTTDAALAGTVPNETWAKNMPVAVPLGSLLAASEYHMLRRNMADAGVETDASGAVIEDSQVISVGRSVAIGGGVAAGLLVMATAERAFAGSVGSALERVWPDGKVLARPVGHLASLGLLTAAGLQAMQYVFHKAERGGDAIEAAYHEEPTSDFVSGGPRSGVSWKHVGREGRRFVNMALPSAEITAVMGGTAIDPIRVFVGLESAATPSERADLAMEELEDLGGFERKLIVFMSPTGTGYLNYVAAESLEYLTAGDVALVAMQYSLRPSPMSLGRVHIGIEQNNAFLHALKWRLSAIPAEQRPGLCAFGESLGAQTAQDVWAEEGARGLNRAGIDRALFLGTPAATKWRERWLADKAGWDPAGAVVEVDNYQQWLALPAEVREKVRFFLLTHHNDPMPKFWFPLAVQRPDWMGAPDTREPGLPKETSWRQFTTFLITLADVKNAMQVVPGQFVANGHDYRKALARFTSLAYNLPIDEERLERMERALRQRELSWAERRLIDQQLQDAQSAVREQLAKWGVSEDHLPVMLGTAVEPTADEYGVSLPAKL
ncbi:MAG: alpha/beta-hydrolase family protein [Candidatus Nanopelagicales bacterium]